MVPLPGAAVYFSLPPCKDLALAMEARCYHGGEEEHR